MTSAQNSTPSARELSIAEKSALTSGANFWHTEAVERWGLPAIMVTDGPHGIRKQVTGGDHLGILAGEPATCFPPAVALGSSWDPELARRVGVALGVEARAEQVSVLLGPGINMKRDPRCGRNFEYYSEDPVHAGVLASAFVTGVQSQGVGTSLKHFAGNNQETDRLRVSAVIDERTLREIYLRAFERVVTEAQPWTLMCSYNRLNGVHASQNDWLLTTVLREEWGFEGLVMSDWGAVSDRVAAIHAGLDLEMPGPGGENDALLEAAVKEGTLAESSLDASAQRVLDLLAKAAPHLDPEARYDREEHHDLARIAAARSVVLLKNDGAELPLDPSRGKIAVIGEFARTPRYQGAGSSQIVPTQLDSLLAALTGQSTGARVNFSAGFRLDGVPDEALAAEALAAAREADHVIFCAGLPSEAESEGFDREDIELPAVQVTLLEHLVDVTGHVTVVLSNGGVVRLGDWSERVPAILEGWLLGQAGGSALAQILWGEISPSGKLTETIPLHLEDVPAYTHFPGGQGEVHYGEGLFIGYRHYDTRALEVAYPFGHGLSYTRFEYRDVAVIADSTHLTVALTVANVGTVDAHETVQVYTGLPVSAVGRPVHELRGFATVAVAAGAQEEVSIRIPLRELAYYCVPAAAWVLEGGIYRVEVAASSRDIRYATTVTVEGDPNPLPLTRESTLGEWAAHAQGAGIIAQLQARIAEANPDMSAMTEDSTVAKMAAQMPLASILRMSGAAITASELTDLLERANSPEA